MHSYAITARYYIHQSLQCLDAEKLEALLSVLCDALPEPQEQFSEPMDRDERARVKAEFELDDLQMAVAVRWAPIERTKRKEAAEKANTESEEGKPPPLSEEAAPPAISEEAAPPAISEEAAPQLTSE